MWDGVRKAFHILIHDCFFPISCVYSPPGRPLEKKELGFVSVSPSVCCVGLHTCHSVSPLLSLSRWSQSTLATVSVHFCLCRVGLLTCHSVSPLLSLSRWSPHLPQRQSTSVSVALVSTLATVSAHLCLCRVGLHTCQCQSTASSWVSVTVRVVISTATLNESVVSGYRRHSQNSCSYLLPLTGVVPESSAEHVSPVTTTTSSRASLFELNVTVPHVLFSASARPTGQLEGRGAEVTDLASLRLAGQCWLLRLIVLARAGP